MENDISKVEEEILASDIVELLSVLLQRAKEGNLRAIAVAVVDKTTMNELHWNAGDAINELGFAVSALNHRYVEQLS